MPATKRQRLSKSLEQSHKFAIGNSINFHGELWVVKKYDKSVQGYAVCLQNEKSKRLRTILCSVLESYFRKEK